MCCENYKARSVFSIFIMGSVFMISIENFLFVFFINIVLTHNLLYIFNFFFLLFRVLIFVVGSMLRMSIENFLFIFFMNLDDDMNDLLPLEVNLDDDINGWIISLFCKQCSLFLFVNIILIFLMTQPLFFLAFLFSLRHPEV